LGRQRVTQRRARGRSGTFTVSLVGYTNAGKSTLFNALTHAGVYAADQLFATLDTTTRRVFLPDGNGTGINLTLSDTVGFIRELPHQLVEAFKATLEETVHADLLLHVIDGASTSRQAQIAQVEAVLAEIGAQDVPRINVINKIDVTGVPAGVTLNELGMPHEIRISAHTGQGLEMLRAVIGERALAKAALGQAGGARSTHEPVAASV
jgi:GTPase